MEFRAGIMRMIFEIYGKQGSALLMRNFRLGNIYTITRFDAERPAASSGHSPDALSL